MATVNQRCGVSRQILAEMMASQGISLDTLTAINAGEETEDPANLLRLLERFAIEVQDESLHLSARPLMPGTNDYVLSSLSHCRTIEGACRQLANAYNFIHGGNYNQVEKTTDALVYRIDDRTFPYAAEAGQYVMFNLDMVLIFIHAIVTTLSGAPVALLKIKSRNTEAGQSPLSTAFPETAISYKMGCFELHYPLTQAELEITQSCNNTLNTAMVYSELQRLGTVPSTDACQSFLVRVRGALEAGLRDQQSVARSLGCSVATLRRRLSAYRTSFRQSRELVLNQEAKLLLTQHLSLEEIASKLDFSDVRSFKRAFRNWNGVSPKQYSLMKFRQHHRVSEGKQV